MAETIPVDDYKQSGLLAEVLPAEGIQQKVHDKIAAQLEDLAIGSISECHRSRRSSAWRMRRDLSPQARPDERR